MALIDKQPDRHTGKGQTDTTENSTTLAARVLMVVYATLPHREMLSIRTTFHENRPCTLLESTTIVMKQTNELTNQLEWFNCLLPLQ